MSAEAWVGRAAAFFVAVGVLLLSVRKLGHAVRVFVRAADRWESMQTIADEWPDMKARVERIDAEHKPNNGTTSWDALTAIDANIRAIALAAGASLSDLEPVSGRKQHED